jgi:hypothetical protein
LTSKNFFDGESGRIDLAVAAARQKMFV